MPIENAMNTILPPMDIVSPHIVSGFGAQRDSGSHGGTDFNYAVGQTSLNMNNPPISNQCIV
ncbi:MAG: hypothetical protein HQM06_03595 [Magnetococcales bacterium]|nr:hypothetical protein [Magnetococcales bacterium]